MAPPKKDRAKLEPGLVPPPDVGDWVFVVYWAPFPMPDNANHGTWQMASARVISVGGAAVCVEVDNPSVLSADVPMGSLIRFVDPGKVFPNRESAERATKELSPPVG